MWVLLAFLSALFAGVTSILAKIGIKKTDSSVATAIRTVIVLLFSWLMVWIVGSSDTLASIGGKSFLFLILSGLATGASWLCYFKALSVGDVNKVVPVDKSSAVLSILLAIVIFGETEQLAVKLTGTLLIAVGTYLMTCRKENAGAVKDGNWFPWAAGSAVFAALQSVACRVLHAQNGRSPAYSEERASFYLSFWDRNGRVMAVLLPGAGDGTGEHRHSHR